MCASRDRGYIRGKRRKVVNKPIADSNSLELSCADRMMFRRKSEVYKMFYLSKIDVSRDEEVRLFDSVSLPGEI